MNLQSFPHKPLVWDKPMCTKLCFFPIQSAGNNASMKLLVNTVHVTKKLSPCLYGRFLK